MAEKLVLVFILIIEAFTGICLGNPSTVENDENCEYLNNMLSLVQKQGIEIAKCASEFGTSGSGLASTNLMCILKCGLTRLGVLNSEGTIDVAGAMALMESSIPPSLRNETMEFAAKCQGAAAKIAPNDSTCKSYEELILCSLKGLTSQLQGVIPKILGRGLGNHRLGKTLHCAGIAGRLEGELLKLDIGTLRRLF